MRMTFASAGALILLAACTPPAPEAEAPPTPIAVNAPSGEYTLDPHHSTVTARARHFGLSGYSLRFNTVSGKLTFNADNPEQSSVETTVAIASLDTPYSGPRDFDAELQNSEWLDAEGFPNATFRSTSVERTGPNTARVTGDLTLHGVTHPLTLDAAYNASYSPHPMGMQISVIGFSARGTFNRSAFGLNTFVPPAGSSVGISDEVELIIETEFSRPVEGATPAPREPAEPVN